MGIQDVSGDHGVILGMFQVVSGAFHGASRGLRSVPVVFQRVQGHCRRVPGSHRGFQVVSGVFHGVSGDPRGCSREFRRRFMMH